MEENRANDLVAVETMVMKTISFTIIPELYPDLVQCSDHLPLAIHNKMLPDTSIDVSGPGQACSPQD
jgi:hypothetical protein